MIFNKMQNVHVCAQKIIFINVHIRTFFFFINFSNCLNVIFRTMDYVSGKSILI